MWGFGQTAKETVEEGAQHAKEKTGVSCHVTSGSCRHHILSLLCAFSHLVQEYAERAKEGTKEAWDSTKEKAKVSGLAGDCEGSSRRLDADANVQDVKDKTVEGVKQGSESAKVRHGGKSGFEINVDSQAG
jgi:hypothetical protein